VTVLAWPIVVLVLGVLAYRLAVRVLAARPAATAVTPAEVDALRSDLAKLEQKVAALSFRAGG
jgi:DNA-binding GntR family transcriptional regulator